MKRRDFLFGFLHNFLKIILSCGLREIFKRLILIKVRGEPPSVKAKGFGKANKMRLIALLKFFSLSAIFNFHQYLQGQ